MRIANTGSPNVASTTPVQETAPVEAPAPVSAHLPGSAASGAMQSATLTPALNALREMPDIDHAKVAALRDALAKGEITFDAGKLAGLIARYHGSQG